MSALALLRILVAAVAADLGSWNATPFGFDQVARFSPVSSPLEFRAEFGRFGFDPKADSWAHISTGAISAYDIRQPESVCRVRSIPGDEVCTLAGQQISVRVSDSMDGVIEIQIGSRSIASRLPETNRPVGWVKVRSIDTDRLWIEGADTAGEGVAYLFAGLATIPSNHFQWFSRNELPDVPSVQATASLGEKVYLANCEESDYGAVEGAFGGLVLEGTSLKTLSKTQSGLPSNCIWDVRESGGNVWFLGSGGISRLDRAGRWTTWRMRRARVLKRTKAYRAGNQVSPEVLKWFSASTVVPLLGVSRGSSPAESPYGTAFLTQVGKVTAVFDPNAVEIIVDKDEDAKKVAP